VRWFGFSDMAVRRLLVGQEEPRATSTHRQDDDGNQADEQLASVLATAASGRLSSISGFFRHFASLSSGVATAPA
jgi:hypothetical protein